MARSSRGASGTEESWGPGGKGPVGCVAGPRQHLAPAEAGGRVEGFFLPGDVTCVDGEALVSQTVVDTTLRVGGPAAVQCFATCGHACSAMQQDLPVHIERDSRAYAIHPLSIPGRSGLSGRGGLPLLPRHPSRILCQPSPTPSPARLLTGIRVLDLRLEGLHGAKALAAVPRSLQQSTAAEFPCARIHGSLSF